MKYILFVLLAMASLSVSAQQRNILDELQKEKVGQGTVTIHQDPTISALLGKSRIGSLNESDNVLKVRGFRVQVYAGNGSRVARNEAQKVAEDIKAEFPELPIYTFFQSPRWLCRVGDFRSVEEADAAMRMLRKTGKFKEVSIVREIINLPLE